MFSAADMFAVLPQQKRRMAEFKPDRSKGDLSPFFQLFFLSLLFSFCTKSAMDTITQLILDPKYHDILSIVKGFRNGIVYGAKVRFPHALVMTFLFKSGP